MTFICFIDRVGISLIKKQLTADNDKQLSAGCRQHTISSSVGICLHLPQEHQSGTSPPGWWWLSWGLWRIPSSIPGCLCATSNNTFLSSSNSISFTIFCNCLYCEIIWFEIFLKNDSSIGYIKMKWNESGFRPPLCTFRLNWARRTSWGWWDEWDDTVLQTHDSKFEPWRPEAEHATAQSRRLPTILSFTRGWGRNIFVSFKPQTPGIEPGTLAWKAAVLTTTLGPPPNRLHTFYGWLSRKI